MQESRAVRRFPSCQATRTTNQSIPYSTETSVTLNGTEIDPYGMHSSSGSKIIIPNGWAGYWALDATAQFLKYGAIVALVVSDIQSIGGVRQLAIRRNASDYLTRTSAWPVTEETCFLTVSTVAFLNVGDELDLRVRQTSRPDLFGGQSLNLEGATFNATYLRGADRA